MVEAAQHGPLLKLLGDVDCYILAVMNSRMVIIEGGGGNWALITHWEPECEVLKGQSILFSGTDHFPLLLSKLRLVGTVRRMPLKLGSMCPVTPTNTPSIMSVNTCLSDTRTCMVAAATRR